jgi:RNA polymerase sigma-70 factor (ECF subfamily)
MTDETGRGSPPGGGGRFATTRWSIVLAAGDRGSPTRQEALSSLCQTYWYPLYAFARRTGMRAEAAQDLTQDFFAHLLEKETLRQVDPEKGRFRSFLLSCFRNYQTDQQRRARAQKRGGGKMPVPIELETAEGLYVREPSHDQTPEKAFERHWALTLLQRAVDRLEQEHTGPRKERMFATLKNYLPGGRSPVPYAEAARELEMNEVTIKVAIHRLRQRFRAVLLEEISHTVDREDQVDDEVRHLLSALGE